MSENDYFHKAGDLDGSNVPNGMRGSNVPNGPSGMRGPNGNNNIYRGNQKPPKKKKRVLISFVVFFVSAGFLGGLIYFMFFLGNKGGSGSGGEGGGSSSSSGVTPGTTETKTTATTQTKTTATTQTKTTATTQAKTTATTQAKTTATTQKATTETTETTEKKDPDETNKKLYKALLDDMYDAWKRGDRMDYWSGTMEYASEKLSQKWNGSRYGDKYQFADINRDGVSELILYDGDGNVMAIYTLAKDTPYLLLEFKRGDNYFHYDFLGVTGDGEIACNFDFQQQRGDFPGKVIFGIEKDRLRIRGGYGKDDEYYKVGETAMVDIDTGYEQTAPYTDDSQTLSSSEVASVDQKIAKATSITGNTYSFASYK